MYLQNLSWTPQVFHNSLSLGQHLTSLVQYHDDFRSMVLFSFFFLYSIFNSPYFMALLIPFLWLDHHHHMFSNIVGISAIPLRLSPKQGFSVFLCSHDAGVWRWTSIRRRSRRLFACVLLRLAKVTDDDELKRASCMWRLSAMLGVSHMQNISGACMTKSRLPKFDAARVVVEIMIGLVVYLVLCVTVSWSSTDNHK